jgi:hypothetical protein
MGNARPPFDPPRAGHTTGTPAPATAAAIDPWSTLLGFGLRFAGNYVSGQDPLLAYTKAAVDTVLPLLPQPPQAPPPPRPFDFGHFQQPVASPPPHPKQATIDALERRALDPGATEEEQRTSALTALRMRNGTGTSAAKKAAKKAGGQ